ncbi:hypothetical protein BH10ACI1_BH10ACI1_24660 [soil metagenome]
MKYVVELNDDDGNHFQIEMHLPWLSLTTDEGNSTWKTLDKGFIKYHSGGCHAVKLSYVGATSMQLVIKGGSGIQFFGLFDAMGLINSSGKGMAEQTWAVSFKSGEFGWTLIS